MKKKVYAIISFKQFLLLCFTAIAALAFVFGLDLFYVNTAANAQADATPVIIIDAGHGGEDGGTTSSSGLLEKDINLSVAQKTRDIFSLYGFETVMTRDGDYLIYDSQSTTIRQKKVSDIHNRMKIITAHPNSIFISIHQNHFEQSKYNGAQVFYSKGSEESAIIAQYIQDAIKESLQKENTRHIKQSGTEIYLLHHATTPAVMVECGFLSNSGEAQKLSDNNYQTLISSAIFSGVLNYLNNRK